MPRMMHLVRVSKLLALKIATCIVRTCNRKRLLSSGYAHPPELSGWMETESYLILFPCLQEFDRTLRNFDLILQQSSSCVWSSRDLPLPVPDLAIAMNLQAPVMRRSVGPLAASQPLRAPRIVAQRQQRSVVGREHSSLFGSTSLKAFTQAPVLRPAKLSSRLLVEAAKKSVGDLGKQDLEGKVVFVRADLNVPLDGSTITDDTRVRAAIPTLKYLISNGAKVLLTSHLVRMHMLSKLI